MTLGKRMGYTPLLTPPIRRLSTAPHRPDGGNKNAKRYAETDVRNKHIQDRRQRSW